MCAITDTCIYGYAAIDERINSLKIPGGVTGIRKQRKDRQYNSQKKKDERTMIYKTLHRELKIEQDEPF